MWWSVQGNRAHSRGCSHCSTIAGPPCRSTWAAISTADTRPSHLQQCAALVSSSLPEEATNIAWAVVESEAHGTHFNPLEMQWCLGGSHSYGVCLLAAATSAPVLVLAQHGVEVAADERRPPQDHGRDDRLLVLPHGCMVVALQVRKHHPQGRSFLILFDIIPCS